MYWKRSVWVHRSTPPREPNPLRRGPRGAGLDGLTSPTACGSLTTPWVPQTVNRIPYNSEPLPTDVPLFALLRSPFVSQFPASLPWSSLL